MRAHRGGGCRGQEEMTATASGTVTFLFTDLAGSAALFDRLGDDRAEQVRRSHFRLLREAVAESGGSEVKSLGDGLMVAFPSALAAVDAAVAVQRAVDRHNRRDPDHAAGVRVGLHVGEPIRDEDDYFGTAVIVARRLCDGAEAGHIVASKLVADLVGSRGDHEFVSLGELELKGLSRRVAACEVAWRPTQGRALPLPSALVTPDRAFLGRDGEMATLAQAWARVEGGGREIVLVAGEPGIGKTRLCAELASSAHAAGAPVLYGGCSEETVVPYQPFVEALRGLAREMPTQALRGHIETASSVLGRLVPELEEPARAPAPDGRADPETERYLLFEAVTELLGGLAAEQPALLVLDDLHWADPPTLLLLRHLLRTPRWRSMLVLGTYRDTELSRLHPLAAMLVELRRTRQAARLMLRGLDAGAVRALIASAAGHGVRADFADAIHRETEGNPFFVEETVRHLVESGLVFQREGRWAFDMPVEEMGIPEGVRDVIGRRLSRLSESCNTVLSHAAVLGRDFEFELLRRVCEFDDEELVAAVEEAADHQVIAERGNGYVFAHALIRQTLYEELSVARKQRLHLRAAKAIEAMHTRDLTRHIGAVALHFRQAGVAADALTAIDYAVRAADAARDLAAWEEAVDHLRAAIDMAADGLADPARVARLHERLGNLLIVTGLDHATGASHLERALEIDTKLGDEVRAAITHSRLGVDLVYMPTGIDVPRALRHLRAAEAVLAQGQDARPLAYTRMGIAFAALWALDGEAIPDTSEQALALARRLDDDRLLALTGAARAWALMTICRVDDASAALNEAWAIADRCGDTAAVFTVAWTGYAAQGMLLDDHSAAGEWTQRGLAHRALQGAAGQRRLLLELDAVRCLFSGDSAPARQMLGESSQLHYGQLEVFTELYLGDRDRPLDMLSVLIETRGASGDQWDALYYRQQRALVRRLRGDFVEAEAELLDVLGSTAQLPRLYARCQLALLAAAMGRGGQAHQHATAARALMAPGSDWRGLTGTVRRAEAVAVEAGGTPADTMFDEALDIMRRWRLPWAEAETLVLWGQALARRGQAEQARVRLVTALGIYAGLDAGAVWCEWARTEMAALA
ncbi:MAG: hypothetical protein E6J45_08570 [Chloroflexi bacterium]|nr:MAG: hypothetical protein E6J45_08570 [Chloroflexota bacterium]